VLEEVYLTGNHMARAKPVKNISYNIGVCKVLTIVQNVSSEISEKPSALRVYVSNTRLGQNPGNERRLRD